MCANCEGLMEPDRRVSVGARPSHREGHRDRDRRGEGRRAVFVSFTNRRGDWIDAVGQPLSRRAWRGRQPISCRSESSSSLIAATASGPSTTRIGERNTSPTFGRTPPFGLAALTRSFGDLIHGCRWPSCTSRARPSRHLAAFVPGDGIGSPKGRLPIMWQEFNRLDRIKTSRPDRELTRPAERPHGDRPATNPRRRTPADKNAG